MGVSTTADSVWLITGCSTGFGREIALAALAKGHRVAVTARKPSAVADIVETHGDRALGLQARQLQAVAKWVHKQHGQPVRLVAHGSRTSVAALVATGLEPRSIGELQLHGCYKSLKQVIDSKLGVNRAPELFCFGLLEQFDIPQLEALVMPRRVVKK